MKPYETNSGPPEQPTVRIMHTLRAGVEVKAMSDLHLLLEQQEGRHLTRPDVLRMAVAGELKRRQES